ncbi:hypothetical protein [Hoylesella timonensis]|uniref:Uncharacterized protein n=1 Tax=Hoylesella timonensis TaxID=386414 RepID=A0A2N6Q6U8_9BACT|nr:hypothetical protein [Hoylesella timonensis]PMC10731.1 hypothetical protein CJ232_04325 [Hoylesella timonensis]
MSKKLIDVDMWVESHERGTKDTRSTGSHGGAGFSQSSHVDRADRAEAADEANHAKESDHAKTADEANHAKKADEATTADEAYKAYKLLDNYPKFKGVTAEEYVRTKEITSQNIQNSDTITTKNINVSGKATFFELEIQKAKAAGGIIIQSAATFKVDDCEDTPAGYVCYQLAEKDGKVLLQMCRKGDQMLCHGGLNVGVGVSHNVSNHYYWRMVTDAPEAPVERGGKKYLKIVLSKTEFAKGSDKPQVGDELAQVGNRVDADRQCVIINSAYKSLDEGLVAPYWAKYVGVYNFELETHRETYFARNDNQIVGNLRARSSSGEIRPIPALLGEWKSEQEYGYYDSVTHDGRQWLCVAVRGTKTTEEPGKGDAWMLLVDKGKNGEDGHSLSAKAFIEGSYRNGRTKGVKSCVKVYYDGQEVKDFTVSYRYKGAGQADWVKPQTNKEDFWVDAQRDGSTLFVEYTVEYKGLKAVAKGRLDNIQDGKDGLDAVVFRLIPKIEKAVVNGAKREKAKVVLFLKYMITRQEGEKNYVELGRLDSFGLSLSIEPSWASFEVQWEDGKPYWVIEATNAYANCFDDTPFFRVCLMQGGEALDARTIGLQYEVEANFNVGKRVEGIDKKIDGIAGKVSTLDGRVSGFESTIDHFRTEVKDKVSHTELKQTAESFSLTVANGTRPNLLWGSDFDLDGVDTTNKRAIQKHLGVELAEIGFSEWFEYLKGGGVAGADAIHIKNVYKSNGWIKWTNVAWKAVPLKPHTKYTISVWVKFKSYGKKGRMYVDCNSDDGRYCFGGYLYKEHYYDRADIDEWQRVRYVFDSGASKRLSSLFFSCIADEEEGALCEIWFCRPKLEEGNTATPWCAYDGTVEALLASGFSLKDKEFTATFDNFKVQNNKGEQTFFVDEKGRINNGMLVSKLRLTEPTIITNENYKKFCYNGKLNGHNVLFLDLLKCGTLLVLTGVKKQLYLDLPSFKYFESYNDNTLEEKAKAQYDKMRYIGNTIILYNINSESVFVSGVLKYKRMAGVKDMNYLDEFGFYTDERLPCSASELASFECKFGITRPEGKQEWYNRQSGVFWEFCYVTIK